PRDKATCATASRRSSRRARTSAGRRGSDGATVWPGRWPGIASGSARRAPERSRKRPYCRSEAVGIACPASTSPGCAPRRPSTQPGPSMQTTTTSADFRNDLDRVLGLKTVSYQYGLSKEELFLAALRNDRGRVRKGGGQDEPKAFATKLGVKGPLVFYTDPECTGRPVKDTYAVAWPEVD